MIRKILNSVSSSKLCSAHLDVYTVNQSLRVIYTHFLDLKGKLIDIQKHFTKSRQFCFPVYEMVYKPTWRKPLPLLYKPLQNKDQRCHTTTHTSTQFKVLNGIYLKPQENTCSIDSSCYLYFSFFILYFLFLFIFHFYFIFFHFCSILVSKEAMHSSFEGKVQDHIQQRIPSLF